MKDLETSNNLMIEHAKSIKRILESNKSNDTQVLPLLEKLNDIIKKLKNLETKITASVELLIFIVQLLPIQAIKIVNSQIRFKVNDYYRKHLKPEILEILTKSQKKIGKYEYYKSQFLKEFYPLQIRIKEAEQMITKNAKLMLEISNILTESYGNYISNSFYVNQKKYDVYTDFIQTLFACQKELLQQNLKLQSFKETRGNIHTLSNIETMTKVKYELTSTEEITSIVIKFSEHNQNDNIRYFVRIPENQNELGILEWLIQNNLPLNEISKKSKKGSIEEKISSLWSNVKKNLSTLFTCYENQIDTSSMKLVLSTLQTEIRTYLNILRPVRLNLCDLMHRLYLLRESLKEEGLCLSSESSTSKENLVQQITPFMLLGKLFSAETLQQKDEAEQQIEYIPTISIEKAVTLPDDANEQKGTQCNVM